MTKYIAEYQDIDNILTKIEIKVKGYSGTTTTLLPTQNPCTITYEVDDEDAHFAEMLVGKATFEFIADNPNLMEDLYNFKFGDIVVLVTKSNGFRYEGALLIDEFTTSFSYVGNVVKVSAIDALGCLDFVNVKKSNGAQFYGNTLIDTMINQVLSNINSKVYFSNTLSYSLTTQLQYGGGFEPNIFKLGYLDASVFKSQSLPISGKEMFKIINRSYRVRAYVNNNGNIQFIDVINSFYAVKNVGFKGEQDSFLLDNSEVVQRRKLYRDSRVRFESREKTGLIPNGDLLEWSAQNIPTYGVINDDLNARTDKYTRKLGDGNEFNKFRFLLYQTGTFDDLIPVRIDGINFKSSTNVVRVNDIVTIDVQVEYPEHVNLINIVPSNANLGYQNVSCWYINTKDLSKSGRFSVDKWLPFNASVITQLGMINRDTADFKSFLDPNAPLANVIGSNEMTQLTPNTTKTISVTLPQIPEGEGYIAVSIFPLTPEYTNSTPPSWMSANEINISKTLLLSVDMSVKNAYSSDNGISIVTRNQEGEKLEETINLNTSSFSKNSNGLIRTLSGTPIDFYTNNLYSQKMALSAYGAVLLSMLNTKNYKLDFDYKQKGVLEVWRQIKLNGLVDNTRSYTSIFNGTNLVQRLSYDTKTNECNVTSLSLNVDKRLLSTSVLSDTIDNMKNYILKNGE